MGSATGVHIETPRLVLRDFTPDDESAMFAIRRDPRFLEFYDDHLGTEEATHELHALFLRWQEEQPRRRFQVAITLRGDDTPIGSVGIRGGADLSEPRGDARRAFEADIGYELNADRWGRGYATEAAIGIVAYGFDTLGMHRISSWCIADNVRSSRVLEKVGLRPEGRLRDNDYFKGRWWDTLLYGLLESDWRNARDQGSTVLAALSAAVRTPRRSLHCPPPRIRQGCSRGPASS